MPLFLQSFLIGRRLVLMPKWDAREAMRLIEQEGVTYFVGVPLMSYEIATHPEREQVRPDAAAYHFAAGGAPRPVEHVTQIREALPHAFPMLGYGLTETNAVGCGNFNENYLAKPTSTGPASRPIVELAIFGDDGAKLPAGQTGEIAFRSIANFGGYWNNPEATAAAMRDDGFFLTGDLGYTDEDGYLFIVDRKKDIIIRGGENISCIEVEQALYAHPDVAEASVFGLPDERFGEVPVAVVFAKPGHALDQEELRTFVAGQIAPFKVPVQIWQEQRAAAPPGHREGRQARAQSPLCRSGNRRYIARHDHQPHPQSARHHRSPRAGRGDLPWRWRRAAARRRGPRLSNCCAARSIRAGQRLPGA